MKLCCPDEPVPKILPGVTAFVCTPDHDEYLANKAKEAGAYYKPVLPTIDELKTLLVSEGLDGLTEFLPEELPDSSCVVLTMDKIQLSWSKAFEDGPTSKFFGVNATISINFMEQEKMNVFVYEDKVNMGSIQVPYTCVLIPTIDTEQFGLLALYAAKECVPRESLFAIVHFLQG